MKVRLGQTVPERLGLKRFQQPTSEGDGNN